MTRSIITAIVCVFIVISNSGCIAMLNSVSNSCKRWAQSQSHKIAENRVEHEALLRQQLTKHATKMSAYEGQLRTANNNWLNAEMELDIERTRQVLESDYSALQRLEVYRNAEVLQGMHYSRKCQDYLADARADDVNPEDFKIPEITPEEKGALFIQAFEDFKAQMAGKDPNSIEGKAVTAKMD